MSVHWFNKESGSEVYHSVEEEGVALMGATIPEVVRLPVELGGEVRRVEKAFTGPCPCGDNHHVLHFVLGDVSVAECDDFLWYSTPEAT